MGGIIFFKTNNLDRIVSFYQTRLRMTIWLEQPDCTILNYGNLLLGFCERESAETEGMITLVFESKKEVDDMYDDLQDIAIDKPNENEKYKIYQFFAKDPEGRVLEFQAFLHEIRTL